MRGSEQVACTGDSVVGVGEFGAGVGLRSHEMNFYDATLLTVVIDWSAGTAAVHLRVAEAEEPVAIVADGLRELRLPRAQSWGPTSAVNSLDVTPTRLTIEMQSGDTIVIDAESVVVPTT